MLVAIGTVVNPGTTLVPQAVAAVCARLEMPAGVEVSAGPVMSPQGPAPYHLVAELSFDSMADLQAGLASPEGQAAAADLANFATGGVTLLTYDVREP